MSSRHVVDLRKGRPLQKRESHRAPLPQRPGRRTSPLKAKRRRLRALVFLIVLVIIGVLAYGIHAVSYSPRFSINHITVNGTQRLEPALIEAFVWSQLNDGSYHYLSRSDIFVYPRPVVEHAIIASLPRVKAAHVSLATPFSQNLVVTIQERQPFAKWCESADSTSTPCYAMDEGGFLFADAETDMPSAYATSYVFSGGISEKPIGSTFIPGHMPGVITLLRILAQQTNLSPATVVIESDQDLTVRFSQGFALKVSFGEDADTVAKNLKLVLASSALAGKQDNIEYIDLRFGNRVYYKLKGEDAVQQ